MTPALARAKAAMLAETARPRLPRWQTSAAQVGGSLVGLLALITIAGLATGAISAEVLLLHVPAILPVLSALVLSTLVAFIPGARRARLVAGVLGVLAAGLLVLLRVASHPSTSPGWVCTASHVGVAVLPGVIAVLALRRAAYSPWRAALAGLAVGASGALVGELVCEQGPLHVLLFHVPAWALSTSVVALVSSKLKPRSFAP